MTAQDATMSEYSKGYPVSTHITAELILHCRAMAELFSDSSPLMVPLRPTDAHKVRYVAGDVSAEGFFITIQYPNGSIETRTGLWLESFSERSSNLPEAQNFGNHMLEEIKSGKHTGCFLWGFTDNDVWSQVWTKGMSLVRHLLNVAL